MRLYRYAIVNFLMGAAWLCGQSALGPEAEVLIRRGIDHTIMARFDSAFADFETLQARYPAHPVGWFYEAATLQSMMMDYETDRWRAAFYAAADSAERRARALLEHNEDDAWAQFYLGSTLSYKGLFQAKNGKVVGGFVSAKKGLRHLRRAVELDSTLADAYLGLGSYDYWSGVYYKYLRFLPWIKDEREKGIAQIKKAIAASHFSYWISVNTLGWIAYNQKDYAQAIECFQRGLAHYPESRFFLWGLADTYFKMKDYKGAIGAYSRLLASVEAAPVNNGYNAALCQVRLAHCFQVSGQQERAFQLAESMLSQPYDKSVKKRLKDGFKTAKKIRHDALKALGRIEVIHE